MRADAERRRRRREERERGGGEGRRRGKREWRHFDTQSLLYQCSRPYLFPFVLAEHPIGIILVKLIIHFLMQHPHGTNASIV